MFTKNKIITIASNLWNFIRMFIERSIYFQFVTTCSISFFLLFTTVYFKILLQNVNKMSLSLQNFRAWLAKTACNIITAPVTLAGFPAKAKNWFFDSVEQTLNFKGTPNRARGMPWVAWPLTAHLINDGKIIPSSQKIIRYGTEVTKNLKHQISKRKSKIFQLS